LLDSPIEIGRDHFYELEQTEYLALGNRPLFVFLDLTCYRSYADGIVKYAYKHDDIALFSCLVSDILFKR
jgi:hypothetical protein